MKFIVCVRNLEQSPSMNCHRLFSILPYAVPRLSQRNHPLNRHPRRPHLLRRLCSLAHAGNPLLARQRPEQTLRTQCGYTGAQPYWDCIMSLLANTMNDMNAHASFRCHGPHGEPILFHGKPALTYKEAFPISLQFHPTCRSTTITTTLQNRTLDRET